MALTWQLWVVPAGMISYTEDVRLLPATEIGVVMLVLY